MAALLATFALQASNRKAGKERKESEIGLFTRTYADLHG
jgi:hypothetical protein